MFNQQTEIAKYNNEYLNNDNPTTWQHYNILDHYVQNAALHLFGLYKH